ncbi:hypothetical protein [Streptomyces similanensis]|uniref:Uncharacterized protein n=1 Tax=Streptomyces similanensis TaxID=1274988 RepID=A0ABP9L7P5_9ACTN
MLTPATPDQLAAVEALLPPDRAPVAIAVVLDTAEVHAETRRGSHTTEAFGRYCRTAVPMLLRRLLAAESELDVLRAQVARYVAAADQGQDPAPGELVEDCKRAGIDLRDEVAAAAAVLEAEGRFAAFG